MKFNFSKCISTAFVAAVVAVNSLCLPAFADNYAESNVAAAETTVAITESKGNLESAYVKWTPYTGAESYNVYVKPVDGTYTQLDSYLVRQYPDYYVADAVGIAKGQYVLKVVPVAGGSEITDAASETGVLNVENYLREGFAFSPASPHGTTNGGYNDDGTPKADADIVYVTDANKDTVTINGDASKGEGLYGIMSYRSSKKIETPLIVRFVGKVGRPALATTYVIRVQDTKNVTFEGIGEDATIHDWSPTVKRTENFEMRNLGIMWWGNGGDADALGMEIDNKNIWIHNNDFFYGKAGADEDQKKGDGCIDMKEKTDYVTISYNHFWDNGKTTFSGGQWELNNINDPAAKVNVTYHHNWFDHADSRHPRCVVGNTHVYNNLYSGNGYGAAACENASVFVENNYFENCDRPMMIGSQGSDTYQGNGVFGNSKNLSGQNGGMIKAYGNYMTGYNTCFDQNNALAEGQIDCYTVSNPKEQVPSTITALKGGWAYNNFDTESTMYSYNPDTPEEAKANVMAYAGRINGGDVKWTFTDADNQNGNIITGLHTIVKDYQSKLISLNNGEAVETTTVEESTTETTTVNYVNGGQLTDEKIWDLTKISTTPEDGIWCGESFVIKTGKDIYYSADGYYYEITSGYVTGNNSPKSATGAGCKGDVEPATGTFVGVTAPGDGVVTVAMRTGEGKVSYITEGADNILHLIDNTAGTNRFDVLRFNVTKGNNYYIYTNGSKARYAYLGFTSGGSSDDTTETTTEITTEITTETTTESVYGDTDKNGKVEAADAGLLLQHILNPGTVSVPAEVKYVDVNADGVITSEDVANIIQKVLDSSYNFRVNKVS